nr:NACHT domain-containing protein [Streptomyces spongiae]
MAEAEAREAVAHTETRASQARTADELQAALGRAEDPNAGLEAAVHWAKALQEASPSPRPADEVLADHERVLLRGEAGSGKTTLVQWLAVSAARPCPDDRMAYLRSRIPFVLSLRTLTRQGERLPTPKAFLTAVDSPLAGEQPPGCEARVLTTGRGLVLIDGIDGSSRG